MAKTGLIGDQFSSEWCHFSTTITLFNQVIHHDDKVRPKKLSRFTLDSHMALNADNCRLIIIDIKFGLSKCKCMIVQVSVCVCVCVCV